MHPLCAETRLRLINEGRFHCCFLVVLLIYVLGTYFNYNLNSVVLFDNLGQKYLSSPLPQVGPLVCLLGPTHYSLNALLTDCTTH